VCTTRNDNDKKKDELQMSASQEKKRRREQREDGTEKRQVSRQKTVARKKRNRVITAVVSILVVVLILAVIVINSNLFYTALPAVTIGGENYTTAEFNYHYFSAYYNFAQTYGNYLSLFLDTSKPLKDQAYSDTQSWADYFEETALASMQNVTMLCSEAEKAGFTLSQEQKDSLSQELASFRSDAISAGYPTADQYAAAAYGRGVTMETVEKLLTKSYLANAYYNEMYGSFTYSADALESAYQANKDSYDYFNYSYYQVVAEADEEAGIDSAAALAAAKTAADEIAAAGKSKELFTQVVADLFDGAEITDAHTAGTNLSSLYADWMKDPERVYGDTTVVEATGGYTVLFFDNRDDNHYNMAQVRHILIMAEADEEGNYTDEALDAAKARAEELYAQWQAGEATEESFAAMANEYSEDPGSNTNGGLYDAVTKGTMVAEFDAFCFAGHESGDTGIVYGESSSYAGYHIMYYVGEGELYSDSLADAALRSEDYAAWAEAQLGSYPITKHFALRFSK